MAMLYALVIFFSLPAGVFIFKQVLWFVYLWQIKEYRVDRVYAHYRYEDTHSGQLLLTFLKFGCAVVTSLFLLYPENSVLLAGPVLTFILYIILFQNSLQEVIGHRLARPKIKSVRNAIVVAGALVSLVLPLAVFLWWLADFSAQLTPAAQSAMERYQSADFSDVLPDVTGEGVVTVPFAVVTVASTALVVLATDLLTHLIIIIWVLLTAPLAEFRRRYLRMRAAAKLAGIRQTGKLKVIAVTGSYGKTTTKELLYQLLSQKYKTVKTPENKNTAVGVAMTVLTDLHEDTEVFIAEMGAYRKGEIRDATEVAPPDVSIVTAVGEQHLALFGSVENIFHAKYEIVAGLREGGLAVLNGDNEYCMRMAEQTDHRTVLYFTVQGDAVTAAEVTPPQHRDQDRLPADHHVYAYDIQKTGKGLDFQLRYRKEEYTVNTPFKARHDISNLLAVMISMTEIGLSMAEVVRLINTTKDLSVPYLNTHEGVAGSVIIDDGYNANLPAFLDALQYTKDYAAKGKRWLMTEGLIELGTVRDTRYKELARKITETVDGMITSDKHLAAAVTNAQEDFIVCFADTDQGFLNHYIDLVNEGDVVLVEGRLSPEVERGIIKRAQ
ncbi:MAG: UDP-N-acetylmuramoyl-tripeptide--D-alanyl-D-alanine ligase [candidate division WS6 bacterium OLB20]|uniref:UDP-N-acetylmuramoyl-tripeptide--D-alanyl-D-alanine ligase n=1 Tax=candidate division WS6 bacterium OLB20 TaxID=1617426 RepID=A0A136LZJ0_9BACT|nr:MAG: UDP-N-acetylmuramoyl-tripeptide--D-alanyl-D-alanine ligase [candidate division WS6 bacterium OLB20]